MIRIPALKFIEDALRGRPTPDHPWCLATLLAGGQWGAALGSGLEALSWRHFWGYLGGSRGDLEGALEAIEGVLAAMLSKDGPKTAQESGIY